MPWFTRCFAGVLGLAALAGSSGAAADTGLEAGLRVGYALPVGDLSGEQTLGDWVHGQAPLIVDLGARIADRWFVGGYAEYALGVVGERPANDCEGLGSRLGSDPSCRSHGVRLGLQAHFHFRPRALVDPWIGLGSGYEWLSFGASAESERAREADITFDFRGFEYANLQLGCDLLLRTIGALGPFVALSIGRYHRAGIECAGDCAGFGPYFSARSIEKQAVHGWLFVGVRATFLP
jgi:hypothetical protein